MSVPRHGKLPIEELGFEDLIRVIVAEHEWLHGAYGRLQAGLQSSGGDHHKAIDTSLPPSEQHARSVPLASKPMGILRDRPQADQCPQTWRVEEEPRTPRSPKGVGTKISPDPVWHIPAEISSSPPPIRVPKAIAMAEQADTGTTSIPLKGTESTEGRSRSTLGRTATGTFSQSGVKRQGTVPSVREHMVENIVDIQFTRSHSLDSSSKGWCPWPFRINCGGCSGERLEPQNVNMTELCAVHYPGREWQFLHPHEQADVIRLGLQAKHFLIDPQSLYMKCWDVLILVCLLLTAIITPYEVTFVSLRYGAFFVFNRVLDLIFMKDMVLQFFLKTEGKRSDGWGTVAIRDPKVIRKAYLRGWFIVDLLTIVPIDLLIILQESDDDSILQRAKILRSLRVLRLVKLLRMLKTSRFVLRWQNYLGISFALQKLAKFMCVLCAASHWMACFWGFIGQVYGKEICTSDGEQIFFDQPDAHEASWITNIFLGGKHSPDNPCNHIHVYASALHWSVMTITSIGYGDIYPVRFEEYVVAVCLQLIGGLTWAYIIGSSCSILQNNDPVEDKFETNTDLLNSTMREARVPRNIQCVYREYLREAKRHDASDLFRDLAHGFSPLLRGYLMVHISEKWIANVYYFRDAPPAAIVEVAERLSSLFYSRREPLEGIRRCLCIVERGTIARGGVVVTNGSVFQLDMIISNRALHDVRPTVSLTYCQVMILTRPNLDSIVGKHPDFQQIMRFHAAKYALARFVRFSANHAKEVMEAGGATPSLKDAFVLLAKLEAERSFADAISSGSGEPMVQRHASMASDHVQLPGSMQHRN